MRDKDLKTPQDRVAWFCEHFGITPPALAYDKKEPGDIFFNDALLNFCRFEGVSLDWICYGGVAGMAATYREKYLMDEQSREFFGLFAKLSKKEQAIFLKALKSHPEGGPALMEALETAREKIEALRAH